MARLRVVFVTKHDGIYHGLSYVFYEQPQL